MKAIGYTATFCVLVVFSALLSGYALSILWAWFFVPVLGLPKISIAGAIGIALVVGFLTHQDQHQDTNTSKSFSDILVEGFIKAIIKPSVALLIGWLVAMWL